MFARPFATGPLGKFADRFLDGTGHILFLPSGALYVLIAGQNLGSWNHVCILIFVALRY